MKQKEIDPDVVIKMFDHLKGRLGYKAFKDFEMN